MATVRFLLIKSFFHKGQHHGIEQHRPYIEEVTVHHTGDQQGKHGDQREGLFSLKAMEKQIQCLQTVEAVGGKANNATGSQDLNNGIVPPGREK